MAADRLACLVPGCRRTFKDDGSTEVICGRHWRAVPKVMRAGVAKHRRAYGRSPSPRTRWLFDLAWARCRQEAVAQALMGLA